MKKPPTKAIASDKWSYGGAVTATLGHPLPVHRSLEERIKRAFELEAQVTVHADELKEIFFHRQLPDKSPRHRDRYVAALVVLSGYMNAVGFPKYISGELIALAQGLQDLDRGTIPHFLKPAEVTARPRDPTGVWAARSWVAAAVQRLIESGSTRRAACKWIADEYGILALCIAPSSKREFFAVIESWHRQLSERDRISKPGRIPFYEQETFDSLIKETTFDARELMETALLLSVRVVAPEGVDLIKKKLSRVKKAPLKSP
ncbi:hypothetical protein [Ancylobacter sp.]|uniref:hypothetical protein n=1 Tax=Ancylobacter sp. TaxID=1872567 RepID=UPI003D1139D5